MNHDDLDVNGIKSELRQVGHSGSRDRSIDRKLILMVFPFITPLSAVNSMLLIRVTGIGNGQMKYFGGEGCRILPLPRV